MRRASWIALAGAAMLAVAGCATAGGGGYDEAPRPSYPPPGATVDASYFYDALSPYGDWVDIAPYGWCWVPDDVPVGWMPYSNGYWAYSDFGWTWVSYDPWGWATCHYGRWLDDDAYGWAWVPGSEWGPAWVAWRSDDDYVGWCPLPPSADWSVSVGLTLSSGDLDRVPADHWCFVSSRDVLDRDLHARIVPPERNDWLVRRTRDETRFEAREGRPVNDGLPVDFVERRLGHPVPRQRIVDAPSPDRGNGRSQGNGTISFFRRDLPRPEPGSAPRPENRWQGPHQGPAQPVALPPAPQGRAGGALEAYLSQQRARLQQEQQNELRSAPQGPGQDEMLRRHQAEMQALEQRAARERQLLEQRQQRQMTKRERGNPNGAPGDRGNGRDRGDRRGHGHDNP